jgi:hypothetical protein
MPASPEIEPRASIDAWFLLVAPAASKILILKFYKFK